MPECEFCGAEITEEMEILEVIYHEQADCIGGDERFSSEQEESNAR